MMKRTTLDTIARLRTIGLATAAGIGFTAVSTAQDDASDENRTKPSRATSAELKDAQKETFNGKIVSLQAYLSGKERSPHRADDDPGAKATDQDPRPDATKTPALRDAHESQALGFLVSRSASESVATEPRRPDETPADQPRRPSRFTNQDSDKLCVLLFEPQYAHLMAKAREACQENDQQRDRSADADRERIDETPKSPGLASDKQITITGKRVMRDGLTAIFVESIQSPPKLSALNKD